MNQEKKTDFIIIGQGLAGSLLAYRLLKAGKRIVIFDLPEKNQSSTVAAGLFNPVTGRRFVISWKAYTLFPLLYDFYHRLSLELKADFFHPMPLFRPFLSTKEQSEVIIKAEKGEYGEFLDRVVTHKPADLPLTKDTGGLLLKNTGYIDLSLMLRIIREKILQDSFYHEQFDENHLDFNAGKVKYKNIAAGKVIFCDGFRSGKSKYFSWLPFRPVKGELILIKARESLPFIFNRQVFVIPYTGGYHKVGATYDWENIDSEPTAEARTYLEQTLNKFLRIDFNTTDQKAGIRPATKDRRPFLGMHPDIPQLGIFNGLGSKGVSLAPYFSKCFTDHLLYGKELDKNADIKRYISLYK